VTNHNYDVQVDWPTVVPLGDTLAVSTGDGFDDRWAKAFEVVIEEHMRRIAHPDWSRIDFDHTSDDNGRRFVVYVRKITPEARASDLRRTVDELVKRANTVAKVGPHVYELARELREPAAVTPRPSSTPPPELAAEELHADAV
jgi:hypothetical protein